MGQPCEVLRFLEWRIDNNDAATLRWRHIGAQRHPAIDRDRLDAAIALEIVCEQSVGLGLELAGDETILWTQKHASERGRARIDGEHIFAFRRCALDPLIPTWVTPTFVIALATSAGSGGVDTGSPRPASEGRNHGERLVARARHSAPLPRDRYRAPDGGLVRVRHRHDVCGVPAPHRSRARAGAGADPLAGLLPIRRAACRRPAGRAGPAREPP